MIAFGNMTSVPSVLAQLDPRVKIISLVVCSVLSFLVMDALAAAFMCVVLALFYLAARVSLRAFAKTIKPFFPLFVFSFIVNILVMRGGVVIGQWGPLALTEQGLVFGLLATYRAVVALGFGALLVATTSPVALANGIEKLLSPLRFLGVPVADVAMIFSIALRAIPLLTDEANQVVRAQKSRGVQGFERGIMERMKSYASLIVPLLSNSLRHAERLAVAMEARCYAAPGTRTHFAPLHFGFRDGLTLALLVALVVTFVVLRMLAMSFT